MIHQYPRIGLILLSVMAFLLTACLPPIKVTLACDFVAAEVFAGDLGTIPVDYVLIVQRISDNSILGTTSGTVAYGTNTIRTVITFPAQLENTELRVLLDYGAEDYETLLEAPCSQFSAFEPGDNRINVQAYASAAIYCDDANQRVAIYGIDGAGVGFPAIFTPYASLPATPAENVLIDSYDNIRFFRLNSGEYQLNVGPDAEGKQYLVIWDGCPTTYVNAYIYQNGVATPTELK